MIQYFCIFLEKDRKEVLLSISFGFSENPDRIRVKLKTHTLGKIQTKIGFYFFNVFPDTQKNY